MSDVMVMKELMTQQRSQRCACLIRTQPIILFFFRVPQHQGHLPTLGCHLPPQGALLQRRRTRVLSWNVFGSSDCASGFCSRCRTVIKTYKLVSCFAHHMLHTFGLTSSNVVWCLFGCMRHMGFRLFSKYATHRVQAI